jgi:hypothetical protein
MAHPSVFETVVFYAAPLSRLMSNIYLVFGTQITVHTVVLVRRYWHEKLCVKGSLSFGKFEYIISNGGKDRTVVAIEKVSGGKDLFG